MHKLGGNNIVTSKNNKAVFNPIWLVFVYPNRSQSQISTLSMNIISEAAHRQSQIKTSKPYMSEDH